MSYTWSKDSFIFIDSSYEIEDSLGHEITSQKDVLLCFNKYQIIDPGPGKHRSLLLRKLFWSRRTLIGNQVYASDSTTCYVSVDNNFQLFHNTSIPCYCGYIFYTCLLPIFVLFKSVQTSNAF